MSSSGFASSTMKSALFPAAIVPRSVSRRTSRGIPRRGDDHLRRRHPCRHHVRHLDMVAPGNAAVGAEGDPHAGLIQARQIPRLNAEGLLRFRAVRRRAVLQLLQFFGGDGVAQPAEIGGHSAIGKVRHENAFGRCFIIATNSSSMSLSRTPCANPSRPARSSPFASSSVKM